MSVHVFNLAFALLGMINFLPVIFVSYVCLSSFAILYLIIQGIFKKEHNI